MAKFRMYKNGLFGHRYKKYYITRNESENGDKIYAVLDSEKNVVRDGLLNYWDAEWEIDKETATPELLNTLKELYQEELYVLGDMLTQLMEKENSIGLDPDEKELYAWVKKIRSRKAENKAY